MYLNLTQISICKYIMSRSKNEVKSDEELPEWFDLEKYTDANFLDANGWYVQFAIRSELQDQTENIIENVVGKRRISFQEKKYQIKHDVSLTKDEKQEAVNEIIDTYGENLDKNIKYDSLHLLSELRDKPIQDISENENFKDLILDRTTYEIHTKPIRSLGVHELTIDELNIVNNLDLYDKNKEDYLPQLDGQLRNSFIVSVDITQPNSILNKQFKDLVLKKRLKLNIKNTKISKYRDWVRLGVLPYFDLTLWANENDKIITREKMAKLIFPEYDCNGKDHCDYVKDEKECINNCKRNKSNFDTIKTTTIDTVEKLFGCRDTPYFEVLIAEAADKQSKFID